MQPEKNASEQFLQHLVNRKTQQAYVMTENNQPEVDEINLWFAQLEQYFSQIFETQVTLKFNRNDLTFALIDQNNRAIDLFSWPSVF